MKIIVADDMFMPEDTVRFALAADRSMNHQVIGVRQPDHLQSLPDLSTFGLAFVDLDFRNTSAHSGLLALSILDKAGVPAVIYAADDEDNRALSLLAAFRFCEPHGLVSKRASSAEIRHAVRVIESGNRMDSPLIRRYARPRGPSYIDRLLPRASELSIWRALARFSERRAIIRAAEISFRSLDTFLNERLDVVAEISEVFHFQAPLMTPAGEGPDGTPGEARHASRLTPMHAFAGTHRRFFDDEELKRLLTERGDIRDPSPASRRGPVRRP